MDILKILIVLAVVVGSVILHELAHGLVAYWLGDRTAKDAGRLTLNPLKHIDPYMSILVPVLLYILNAPVFGGAKPVPVNYRNLKWREWGMAFVAFAGPFMNFLLAFIAFLIGYFSGLLGVASGSLYYVANSLPAFVIVEIVMINLGFMVFNLIPIPPLDGSRILYAIAPDGVRTFMMNLEAYGVFIVYGLIFFFGPLFSNIMSGCLNWLLNLFIFIVK